MGDIACFFHFQPSELWGMDVDELLMWHGEAVRIDAQQS